MQNHESPAGDEQTKRIAEVMETEHRWVQAHRDLDVAVIAEILDDDYVRIEKDGSTSRKRDVVASYNSGKRHWDVAKGASTRCRCLKRWPSSWASGAGWA